MLNGSRCRCDATGKLNYEFSWRARDITTSSHRNAPHLHNHFALKRSIFEYGRKDKEGYIKARIQVSLNRLQIEQLSDLNSHGLLAVSSPNATMSRNGY